MNYDKAKLARHEAAHFVVAWAVECPAFQSDISESAHKVCDDGEIFGVTFGYVGRPTPFEHILIALAGIVADRWEKPNTEILEIGRSNIDGVVADIADGDRLDADDDDWNYVLRELAIFGVDVLDVKFRNEMLLRFLDAVRSILKTCATSWRDATEYLIQHGRIGFDGAHCDQGDEAYQLFARWENEDGEKPDEVTTCVEQCRRTIQSATVDADTFRSGTGGGIVI